VRWWNKLIVAAVIAFCSVIKDVDMTTHYFRIGDHVRRTINGAADCCQECGLPRRFSISADHQEIEHPCSMYEEVLSDAEIEASLEDDELDLDAAEDDDLLDLGFTMRSMSTAIDYGGEIEE
jgi:hypothetical protein